MSPAEGIEEGLRLFGVSPFKENRASTIGAVLTSPSFISLRLSSGCQRPSSTYLSFPEASRPPICAWTGAWAGARPGGATAGAAGSILGTPSQATVTLPVLGTFCALLCLFPQRPFYKARLDSSVIQAEQGVGECGQVVKI